jgi:hypothetical protein
MWRIERGRSACIYNHGAQRYLELAIVEYLESGYGCNLFEGVSLQVSPFGSKRTVELDFKRYEY